MVWSSEGAAVHGGARQWQVHARTAACWNQTAGLGVPRTNCSLSAMISLVIFLPFFTIFCSLGMSVCRIAALARLQRCPNGMRGDQRRCRH